MTTKRGATILELMICMVILTGVIIVFATVFPFGFRLGLSNLNENKAASLASSVLEEVKGLPFSDSPFDNGQPSTIFTLAALSVTNVQTGWPGATVVNTNPPSNTQPILTTLDGLPATNFPRTIITVGVPQPGWPGDQGVFTLPIQPGDTPAGVTGIDVETAAIDITNGNLVTLPANAIITATVRVTVAWTETRQSGQTSINKSVTMTGYVSQNTSQQ